MNGQQLPCVVDARNPARIVVAVLFMAGCAAQPQRPSVAAPSKTPAAQASGAKAGMAAGDARAITAYHNKARADVGVGPWLWSADLARYAQQWADHLARTTCTMAHRPQHRYGENLFQGTAGYYTAVEAAKAWESEKKDYRGGLLTPSNWHPAGHYTQMVWRGTNTLGCGEAMCRDTVIVACNYAPPGNVIGHSPY